MALGETTLITGGAGFIGATLGRALADAGQRVILTDVRDPSPESRFILEDGTRAIVQEDLSVESREAVFEAVERHRPDHVIHLGAVANPVAIEHDPMLALRVNVEGTMNMLEASRELGVISFVYFSSIGALAAVQYEPIDASHPTVLAAEGPGAGFYGAAKVASEAFALTYPSAFGLDVRVIRPSAVYGLGMNWPIYIKPMVENAVQGRPVRFESGGRFPRDYTHVDDVATLAIALLDAPPDADRLFYGATGRPLVTGAELAAIVAEVIPGADIEIADPLSHDDELEIRYRGVLSIDNAREQLGWEPCYPSLRKGIEQYARRYREFLTG